MKRARAPIAVLTADVVGSSRYSSTDRRKLDEVIRKAFAEVERRFPDAIHTRLAFRITAGDEFQCVISDTPRALDILTYFRAVVAASGLRPTVRLRASVGIGELTERGDLHYSELTRVRTHRTRDRSGKYRWYNDHQLPDRYGGGIVTVRLHNTEQDTARKLNRTENVRPISPTDPDFARLYPRRNDAESINRNLDDTLWLRRAHSRGHQRQTLNLLGYALMINALALHRHRRRRVALAA